MLPKLHFAVEHLLQTILILSGYLELRLTFVFSSRFGSHGHDVYWVYWCLLSPIIGVCSGSHDRVKVIVDFPAELMAIKLILDGQGCI